MPCIASRRGCAAGCFARDISGSHNLPFTQEYLAEMLGVRRTSVTAVAHSLQQEGLIRYARGKIEIVDAAELVKNACECYGSVKGHYRKLIELPVAGAGWK